MPIVLRVCGSTVAAILPADREEETGASSAETLKSDGDGSKRWHGSAAADGSYTYRWCRFGAD